MRSRLLGVVPWLLAAVVYGGLVLPLKRQVSGSLLQMRKLDEEQNEVSLRLASLERREALSRRAAAVFSPAAGSEGTLRAVRRSVVSSLSGAGVSGVRLSMRAGATPVVASVRITAEGGFAEIVRLSGHLVRPGSGLVLERARFSPRSPRVGLDVEAVGLRARP